ncbi:MAG: VPLPA-CTERM sorting domain-containing protein [Gammaproteobacteria bacterium]|nr:VPLPA-CTERM sorting domain-containing protein [Gammaproteobacteria bacterium]
MRDSASDRFWVRLLAGTLMGIACSSASGLTINPVYVDGLGNWDSVGTSSANGRITFNAAISVWEALIAEDMIIDVTVTFDDFASNPDLNAGAIGVWQGGVSCSGADCINLNVTPDSPNITHTIFFDSADLGSLFFDESTEDASDLDFFDFDAFSIALHEIGHMLGFTNTTYSEDFFGTPFNPWDALIDRSNVFDPAGLAVQMFGDRSHLESTGVPGGALMEPSIFNGERRLPSMTEVAMLSRAYGYQLVPVPAAFPLFFTALAALGFLRRRKTV